MIVRPSWFRRFLEPRLGLISQVLRALVTSVIAATLDVAVLVGLVELAGWSVLSAVVAGYLVGCVVQYVLCSLWVFGRTLDHVGLGFIAFTILSSVGLGITSGTVYLLESIGVAYLAAKIISLGVAFVWNFMSRRRLLYREG